MWGDAGRCRRDIGEIDVLDLVRRGAHRIVEAREVCAVRGLLHELLPEDGAEREGDDGLLLEQRHRHEDADHLVPG